jgi:hypothetical protein
LKEGQSLYKISKAIQNTLVAFVMASSIMAWYTKIPYAWLHIEVFHIPVLWMLLFVASMFVANDVRTSFQKVLWFQKREDPLPIWQVGIGMIFYFAQIAFVEQFMREWMHATLGGMPLYIVISFINAFLCTVIYQEIFYVKKKELPVASETQNKEM